MHRVTLSIRMYSTLMPGCACAQNTILILCQIQYSSGTALLAAAYQYLLRNQDQWHIQDTAHLPADKDHCSTEKL